MLNILKELNANEPYLAVAIGVIVAIIVVVSLIGMIAGLTKTPALSVKPKAEPVTKTFSVSDAKKALAPAFKEGDKVKVYSRGGRVKYSNASFLREENGTTWFHTGVQERRAASKLVARA